MGLTKSEIFSKNQNEIAGIAKVLAHPARVAIIQHLINQNSCICGDLVDQIGLAQPTISQHLRELKNAGVLKGNIEGTKVCYCIDSSRWKELQDIFDLFFRSATAINTKCC